MQFTIIFLSSTGYAAISPKSAQNGLEALDQIRAAFGSTILPEDVAEETREYRHDFRAVVDEIFARKSERFKVRHELEVKVPEKGLNRYLTLHPAGAPGKYTMEYRLDGDKILVDWEKAGYPLEWDPSQKEE